MPVEEGELALCSHRGQLCRGFLGFPNENKSILLHVRMMYHSRKRQAEGVEPCPGDHKQRGWLSGPRLSALGFSQGETQVWITHHPLMLIISSHRLERLTLPWISGLFWFQLGDHSGSSVFPPSCYLSLSFLEVTADFLCNSLMTAIIWMKSFLLDSVWDSSKHYKEICNWAWWILEWKITYML